MNQIELPRVFNPGVQTLLNPLGLNAFLKVCMEENIDNFHPVSIKHISPNTLRFGSKLQKAFETLGSNFNICCETFTAKTDENIDLFLSRIKTNSDDFILLQVHGIESEERLLEPVVSGGFHGRLIVLIHRPEELILRIAYEESVTYSEARNLLANRLCMAKAIVLCGASCVLEYQEMLPQAVVTAIPLGFTNPGITVDLSKRISTEELVCLGSNTTWGEMRHIDDLFDLMKAIRQKDVDVKILGYVQGNFDQRINWLRYLENPNVCFLSNGEIEEAFSLGNFQNEYQFREWLYEYANERVIIRAQVHNGTVVPESFVDETGDLYRWEQVIIDFNLQLYHEVLDKHRDKDVQGLPKVEYSGTLHKGASHEIFVVFESLSMKDMAEHEGFQMIEVQIKDELPVFEDAVDKILDLIKAPSRRLAIIEKNSKSTKLLGMQEIAFAYFVLMQKLLLQEQSTHFVK